MKRFLAIQGSARFLVRVLRARELLDEIPIQGTDGIGLLAKRPRGVGAFHDHEMHANSALLDIGNAFTNVFIACDEDDVRNGPLFGENDEVANEEGIDALASGAASYQSIRRRVDGVAKPLPNASSATLVGSKSNESRFRFGEPVISFAAPAPS